MSVSPDNVAALDRLDHLTPSDIDRLREFAGDERGRAEIIRALDRYLTTMRASDAADWDEIFTLGAQMRGIFPRQSVLGVVRQGRPSAEFLIAGFQGRSFDDACDAFEQLVASSESGSGGAQGDDTLLRAS